MIRRHSPIRAPGRQRGLALITAVLVVAIVATVAAYLGLGQQVWLRQTENLAERAQADSLRRAGLDWIAVLLAREAREGTIDHLGEMWAKQLPPLPAEGGMLAVTIRDAQGLINLNNLLRADGPGNADIAMFQRLLRTLGLDPALTEPLLDWIDPDSDTRAGGAEDVDYLALPQPYRPANQPLTSVDELRLVRGFTAEAVDRLRPYVTVLPKPTTLNVNTAPEAVLSALFADGATSAVAAIIRTRETQPIRDATQLNQLLAGTPPPQPAPGFNTQYFLVTLDIRINRLDRRAEALIARPADGKPATVLWHRMNPVLPERPKNESS